MRLRRLEVVFIGVTLAFAVFMGGFFTGRSWSAVNIVPAATNTINPNGVTVQQHGLPPQEVPTVPDAPANPASPESMATQTNPQAEISQEPQIFSEPDSPQEAGAPRGGDGRININIATQTELTDLPGIGSVLASRIIDYRRQYGDFLRIEDIRNVSGIGEKRYEAIQDKITVG